MEFSRQEYWSEWVFPPPGDLPNLRMNPSLLHLLLWQGGSLGSLRLLLSEIGGETTGLRVCTQALDYE